MIGVLEMCKIALKDKLVSYLNKSVLFYQKTVHGDIEMMKKKLSVLLASLSNVLLMVLPVSAEVMLQWFETEWDEMYRRIPEVAETGYSYIWCPPPTKAPTGTGTIWGNVGYSLYDRFDIGDVPQRGSRATRYGTRGSLRNMVDNMHQCDVKIIPDIVMNHNGNGPDFREYPGMRPTDFHVWYEAGYCNGLNYKRAPRMDQWSADNGYGGTMYQDLCSLIDIRTEDNKLTRFWDTAHRFTAPNGPGFVAGESFTRHIGQYDRYPYYNPETHAGYDDEKAADMLYRWISWLGDAIDYDGLRLDAGKHTPWEFFGNGTDGFLHEAQWNTGIRRGIPDDERNDNAQVFQNYIKRDHSLIFAEILSHWSDLTYWADKNPMRFLDYGIKKTADNALKGNIGAFYGYGTDFGPEKGVMYIWGHDEGPADNVDLGYAYTLSHIGLPMVYFTGKNIEWKDKEDNRTWMIPGYDDYALGDNGGKIQNMVWVHNNFAWGKEYNRWSDSDFLALERFDDLNSNGSPDSGEAILLVAMNDSGSDISHEVQTSFADGTVLKDYTGSAGDVTVYDGGKVYITVPGNYGQGWVYYAPYTPEVSFTIPGAGSMDWIVPGGVHGEDKARTLKRITANNFSVDATLSGASAQKVCLKWGGGTTQVGTGAHYTNHTLLITADFEEMSGSDTSWSLAVSDAATKIPEGLNAIKVRAYSTFPDGTAPARFNTATEVVYVDLHGPELDIPFPADGETIIGQNVMVINNTDFTAYEVSVALDGGSAEPADEIMKGSWKYNLPELSAGSHTAVITATEADWGSPRAVINTSVCTRVFSVAGNSQSIAISHNEDAQIEVPFFTTGVSAPGSPDDVKLYWDGYELPFNGGSYSNIFNGEVVYRDFHPWVETNHLWGNFVNGPHFFEAVRVDAGVTSRCSTRVVFNLYGQHVIDSDGDSIPDNVEIPFFDQNAIPDEKIPGDDNQNCIPEWWENWSRLNPYNHSTFYNGQWDDQNDFDGDGYSNYQEVYAGYVESTNIYTYDIYRSDSHPEGTPMVPAEIVCTPMPAQREKTFTVTYKPNDGSLQNAEAVNLVIGHSKRTMGEWQDAETIAMTWDDENGYWTADYLVPAGATSVDFVFTDGVDTWDNNSQNDWQITVQGVVPKGFVMDGVFDSEGYKVVDVGDYTNLYVAIKGTDLYVATASEEWNDSFIFVTKELGNGAPSPWDKNGYAFFDQSSSPYFATEGDTEITYQNNVTGVATSKPGGAYECSFNLLDTFGSVPDHLYIAAVVYQNNTGGGMVRQVPATWGGANNDLEIMEFQRIEIASVRDDDGDGTFDNGAPYMETTVNGDTRDANYDLRRFFVNELARDQESIAVTLWPNAGTNRVSDVELFSNLNRRDFAVMPGDEEPDSVTTASDATYYRAYTMSDNGDGSYGVTLLVSRCGAYRINARYRVNGGDYVYYTDHALRRDCAVVVSPTKALQVTMYEVNPMTAEATNATFYGRSTFEDMYVVNQDRPDRINTNYFQELAVNMVWLQPVHPIGSDNRQTDPLTGADYDPGSPYAVRNYWKVNSVLGEPYTGDGSQSMAEFVNFVAAYDACGVGVMLDGTFNHSAWDCEIGDVGVDMFDWATNATDLIRDIRPGWYANNGDYGEHATYYGSQSTTDIGAAPDRIDFNKWSDAAEFNFGTYDCLVQGQGQDFAESERWRSAWAKRYLLEEDRTDPLDTQAKEVWQYFSGYPRYWLEKTGHPAGTPKNESYKGIDGLRCDFAQGLPSAFWEYTINKTRSIKWDFLFMAESLDGYATVSDSNRHGVGYRSARHFDILNENLVFYWRNTFFAEFNGGSAPTSAFIPDRRTTPTQDQLSTRKAAFDNVPILLNLTSHDEVLPTSHQPSLMYAYAELCAVAGVPMLLYGQEAGMQNDYDTYNYDSAYRYYNYGTDPANNAEIYELNFGKSIVNFKRYNCITSIWHQGSTAMPGLNSAYGRINTARLRSPALQSQNDYFLSHLSGGKDESIFAVAKYEAPGVSAAEQDVVFVFVNNDCQASTERAAMFSLDADYQGKNWFGIISDHNYNVADLVSPTPTNLIWDTPRTGADIIANGMYVGLSGDVWAGTQMQFLKLIDVAADYPRDPDGSFAGSVHSDWDFDKDGLANDWEIAKGLDPHSATGVNGSTGDKDGDGACNEQEYLCGTDPDDAADVLQINSVQLNGAQIDINWASKSGVNYLVEYRTNLLEGAWQPAGALRTAGSESQTQVDSTTESNRFYRVRVRP
ncbi:MAG: DUF1939 domain-containing protein [Spartobacteria bacterium]|nr:DUF1939 domain-containing protein [Spartobacteria bacterium]